MQGAPAVLQPAPTAALSCFAQVETAAFERVKESLARRYRNANMRPEQVEHDRMVACLKNLGTEPSTARQSS